MRNLLRVLRGLLGIGAVGAAAGGGFLAVLAALVELIGDGTITPRFIGAAFLVGAGPGLAIATAFGAVLALTSRGRRLEQLSFWGASAVSAVIGAFLAAAVVTVGGGFSSLASMAPAVVIGGLFGGLLGGGLIMLGKEARLRELRAGSADEKLLEE